MFVYNIFVNTRNKKQHPLNTDKKYRYYLDIECKKEDKIAMIIMQNPSKAKEYESDVTVNKVLNYLYDFGYNGITIMSVVSFYGENIVNIVEKDYQNKEILIENCNIIKNNTVDKIFVTEGGFAPKI